MGPKSGRRSSSGSGETILESTFTSFDNLSRKKFPISNLLPNFLIKYKFKNIEKIKSIETPLLIFHSSEDDIIPFSHGKELFAVANEPKEFVEVSGSHNDSASASGVEIFNVSQKFLKK